MKCEPLGQHALHVCALLKVSVSACFSSAVWLEMKAMPFAGLPRMQNFRSLPLGTNNAFG